MSGALLGLLLIGAAYQSSVLQATSTKGRKELNRALLRDYNRDEVPIDPVTGQGVNVTVYMWPYDILYVKEAKGAIRISGWIDMRWTDPHLSWNPDDYGGLNETFLTRRQIWLPEIDLFYSKDGNSLKMNCPECPSRVSSAGLILRGYYFAYSFPCNINVKYFPFDEHFCKLQLANWHLDDRNMDLWFDTASVDLSIFLKHDEWDLLSMNVTRQRDFYNYGFFPILSYSLHIRRKPYYYVCNLVLPIVVLVSTAILGFHMPSIGTGVHQEKVKMGLTTILSIFILQLGVSDKMPRTSDVIPLIAVFYCSMVGLLSMAIVATSLIILVEKQGIYDEPVPRWVRRLPVCRRYLPDRVQLAGGAAHFGANKKHCRMLDCGCRLRRRLFASAQPAVAPSRVAPQPPALSHACHYLTSRQPDGYLPAATAVFDRLLDELSSVAKLLLADAADRQRRAAVRAEWRRLADLVEIASLCSFLVAIGIILSLFFNHDWY